MDFLDTLIVDELIDEMNKDKTVACFYMFISNHKEVLQELDNRGIPYIVVYPEKELKNEVLNRIYTRNTEQPNKQIGDRFNKEFDIWYKEWINAKNKIACTKQFPTITDLFKEGLL